MKKIYLILAIVSLVNISCKQEFENWYSSTKDFDGHWTVTADAVKADGTIFEADALGLGKFQIDTYNTSSNVKDTIWLNDHAHMWDFKIKIKTDANSLTFSGTDLQNKSYDSKVTIENGKILKGAARTGSGTPADSIVFTVIFNDDKNPEKYGFHGYKVSGIRYTGFVEDTK